MTNKRRAELYERGGELVNEHELLSKKVSLSLVAGEFAVCRLPPHESPPTWIYNSNFYAICKTTDELSFICEESLIESAVKSEKEWKIIKVVGPLDFNLTGILSSLASPLADAGISIFAVSTFDTDYVLVKKDKIELAQSTLKASGFNFI